MSFIFKGQSTNSGKWVTGCLFGDSTIIPTGQEFTIEGGKIYDTLEAVDVIPETVTPLFGENDVFNQLDADRKRLSERNEELHVMLADSYQKHLLDFVIPELELENKELRKEIEELRAVKALTTNTAINEYNIDNGGKGMIACNKCKWKSREASDKHYCFCTLHCKDMKPTDFCSEGVLKAEEIRERERER